MTEADLYKQYLAETGKAPQAQAPSEADLYQQYLAEKTQAPERKAEAFTQSFGNSAAFGYLPQLQAIAEPAIQGVLDQFLPEDPKGFTVNEAPQKNYTQRRDEYIREGQQLSDENPYSSAAGTIAGVITSGAATGGGLAKLLGTSAKAATMGGRLAQAGKTGIATGLIRNPGDTEGEISPLQPLDRVQNAGTDALTGMVFQGGLEGLGKAASGIKNASQNLKDFAEKRALSASGAMKRDFKLLDKLGTKSSVGRTAIEEGLVKAGDSVEDIAEKVVTKKNEVGNNIGKIYSSAKDELAQNPHLDSEINLHKILDDFEAELSSKYKGKAGGKKVINSIKDRLEDLRDNKEKIDLDELFKIRQDIDREARKAKAWGINQDTDVAEELKALRNKIQDAGSNKISEVDQAIGTNFTKDLKVQNKRYSDLKSLEGITKDGLSRDQANRIYGLSEQIGTMAGTVAKGPVAGLGLGVANRVIKKYGDSTASAVADKLSKILSSNPKALGAFADPLRKAASVSPQRFSVQVNLMLKKPEFQRALDMIPEIEAMPAVGDGNSGASRSPSNKFIRKNQ